MAENSSQDVLETPTPSTGPALPPEGLVELEDGSVLVPESDEASPDENSDFYANLAETLDQFTLTTLASELVDLIELDQKAREERDKQQEEGIRRTGLGNDAPGGATFSGASKIVHPVLAEGCVDFSARVIKELFPSNGPVKTKIVGEGDKDTLEKARKKRDFLNFYLIERMPEYRSEKETLLTQLPLGGSQYEKYWFDGKRIRMEFVPIDKVLLPFFANSFYAANRITHIKEQNAEQIAEYVESGFYTDVFGLSDQQVEETGSQKATDKIEGKTPDGYNEDGVRIIYEVSCNWDIEGDGVKPYVVHIDGPSDKICGVYRNWKETDAEATRLDWWVEDKFIPWRGAYGIGLLHLIGSLSAALTGALRALLDSAHINNSPTAIKLKGGRTSGQNVSLDMTAVTEIEAPTGTDDIRKIMMPVPFNPPSTVLFQLLEWITNQAKGVVATAEEKIADAGSSMPVGTALALIEQGSQVFSSIHARLHDAQRRALKIICRLIADYPEHVLADLGRFGLVPEDFLDSDDVAPVSDPNIFSETQRFAQMQSAMQLAAGDAQDPSMPWNKIALRRRMLELLRLEGIDELLPMPPDPVTADPVMENAAIMQGAQVKAAMEQEHDAHIKTHLMFILQPLIAKSENISAQALAKIMDHVSEHMVLSYLKNTQAAAMQVQLQATQSGVQLSPDQLAFNAAMLAQERTSQQQEQIAQLINEAGQIVKSKIPPPPVDPAVQATKEVAMAQIQQKAQIDQAKQQMEQQKFQYEQQFKEREFQAAPMLAAMKQEFEANLANEKMMREEQAKQFSELMANQRNEADNRQKQMTELLKNRDDNETIIQTKLMEIQQQAAQSIEPAMRQMQEMLSALEQAKSAEAVKSITETLRGLFGNLFTKKGV